MPKVPAPTLRELINNVKDPAQKRLYNDLINGNIESEVHCYAKGHPQKSSLIGHIYTDGRIIATTDDNGKMWMRASRRRLDGELGFQCWCGNDTRLAEAEAGVISKHTPTKKDLETVASRLKERTPNYPEQAGKKNVDGFSIERVM